jgi:hypothetical protein
MNAEEWADFPTAYLYDELEEFAMPLEPEVAWRFVRSAFGRGYMDAFEEENPMTLREALGFTEELALRLPVS